MTPDRIRQIFKGLETGDGAAFFAHVAEDSIGSKDVGRQRGLVLEQRQLITELQLFQSHLEELENEMVGILASARGPRYPRLMNDWSH